jgi:catechol 2,3-dioxygenase-like lactoylglutathione lyase family enzyme/predicted nucleotidyltransferase
MDGDFLADVIDDVQRDPDSLGLIVHGSRAGGGGRSDSDVDLIRIVIEPARVRRERAGTLVEKVERNGLPRADVLYQSPERLRALAERPDWYTATFFSCVIAVDKSGEIAALVDEIGARANERAYAEVPRSYDAYLNSFVRSIKSWRNGDALGGRLHAAESAFHLLRALFGLERRWPPYHDQVAAQLPSLERAIGWEEGSLREAVRTLVGVGDPGFQQTLERGVEDLLRSRGFEHEWENDLEPLQTYGFDPVFPMEHLALGVVDEEATKRFYETYLGFGGGESERMDDGVLFVRNLAGFNLALGPSGRSWEHVGFRVRTAEEVRAIGERLRRDGVAIVEEWDEPDYVSVKCLDPDGHIVELSWEPR